MSTLRSIIYTIINTREPIAKWDYNFVDIGHFETLKDFRKSTADTDTAEQNRGSLATEAM